MDQKLLLFTIISILFSGIYLVNQGNQSHFETSLKGQEIQIFKEYQKWKQEFGENYNGREDEYRFQVFSQNWKYIEENNAKATNENDVILKINSFSTWTLEEFVQRRLTKTKGKSAQIEQNNYKFPIKQSNIQIDWKEKGAVWPTEDQGNCGSCWAFSGVEALQGLKKIVEGQLIQLSVQQWVDCIPKKFLDPGAHSGCFGSEPYYGFTYNKEAGIQTWESYPYVSGKTHEVQKCQHKKSKSVFFNDGDGEGYVLIDSGNVEAIKLAIMRQPLAVEVAADSASFMHYHKGILDDKNCGTELDHGILMYGIYDLEGETPYYMVQNSWGKYWGDKGYAKISIAGGDGTCGINKKVSYPTTANYP